MLTGTNAINNNIKLLVLLSIGYFIDFYDLTIFSSSYTQMLPSLLNITDSKQIQSTYLFISIFYTLGILAGSVFFGILGDKLGRSRVVKLTILLYSLATLGCLWAYWLPLLIVLRFLVGAGLATEFAISATLIGESFDKEKVPLYTAILYVFGILGGIFATLLSGISWHITFIVGGVLGLLLLVARSTLKESPYFNQIQLTKISKGNIWHLFRNKLQIVKLIKLSLLILPFNFLISIMFIFPSFMKLNYSLSYAIHLLLIGFFIGNLISTLMCSFIVKYFNSYKVYLFINLIVFTLALISFAIVTSHWFLFYSIILGLISGGLPTIWIQVVTKSYGVNIRSTASNLLFAIGRSTTIVFNLIIMSWLNPPSLFVILAIITTLIIGLLSLMALKYTKENFNIKSNFVET